MGKGLDDYGSGLTEVVQHLFMNYISKFNQSITKTRISSKILSRDSEIQVDMIYRACPQPKIGAFHTMTCIQSCSTLSTSKPFFTSKYVRDACYAAF